jgi:hypothetical protein
LLLKLRDATDLEWFLDARKSSLTGDCLIERIPDISFRAIYLSHSVAMVPDNYESRENGVFTQPSVEEIICIPNDDCPVVHQWIAWKRENKSRGHGPIIELLKAQQSETQGIKESPRMLQISLVREAR